MTEEFKRKLEEAKGEALNNYEEKVEECCDFYRDLFYEINSLVLKVVSYYDYDTEKYNLPNLEELGLSRSWFDDPRSIDALDSYEGLEVDNTTNHSYIEIVYVLGDRKALGYLEKDLELINEVLSVNDIKLFKLAGRESAIAPRLVISFDDSILHIHGEKEQVKQKVCKNYFNN